ncbi:MAG: hypothetical protein ACRDV0_08840 [Acidimicrobiales bacterium]
MYQFARTGRLTGQGSLEWAQKIGARAAKVMEHDNTLYASTLSPGFGTVAWVSHWDDLASFGESAVKLAGDEKYMALAAEGAEHVGPLDDRLSSILWASAAVAEPPAIVSVVRSLLRAGSLARGVLAGIEIAMKFHEITGLNAAFQRDVTGDYGGVAWLSAMDGLADVDAAEIKMAADVSFVELLDSSVGCYSDGPGAATAAIYRRVG